MHKIKEEFFVNLYSKISALCEKNRITVTDMCSETGTSRGSLGDLKSGKKRSLSSEALAKIAAYFGISINELMSPDEPRMSEVRLLHGLEREDLAKELGITAELLEKYENNDINVPEDIIKNTAELLAADEEFVRGEPYIMSVPVAAWSKSDREAYSKAQDELKHVMEYKLGKPKYIRQNEHDEKDAEEETLISLFRETSAAGKLRVIQTVLNIHDSERNDEIPLYAAAKSEGNRPPKMTAKSRTDWENIKNLPNTDQDLM